MAAPVAGAGGLLLLLGGCGTGADTPEVDPGALGSPDDEVVALSAATGATDGRWDGDVLVLDFAEGSRDDPGATVNCSAVNRLIAAHERAVLAYPDGDLDCEEARTTGEAATPG